MVLRVRVSEYYLVARVSHGKSRSQEGVGGDYDGFALFFRPTMTAERYYSVIGSIKGQGFYCASANEPHVVISAVVAPSIF